MFSAVPGRLVPGRYRSLFADRTFRRLMPVFALSDLGDGMTVVAVAWMALALAPDGGQGALIGIAVAAYILPGALGALVLGRWMRRLPAQRLLIIDSGLRAVLLGGIPLVYVAGALTPAVYVGLLGASSLLHAWGKAGKHALFAPLLCDDQRLAANSVLSTSLWSATIAGPALAGLLVGLISPAWIIGLDAATFAVLALQTGRTSLPAASTPGPAAGDTRHELSILRRQPDLLGLLVVTWLFNLAFGPVEVALPLFVTDDLDAGSELLGQYWAAFGIGAVIGALALGVARRLPLWPAMLAIIAGHGIGMLPFAVTHTAVPSLIGFAFAGLVYGPYSALSFTVLQDRAPADSLTTVLAARSAVLLTAFPLGAVSGGFLVDLTSAPAVLTGCGGLMILIAVISAIMPKLYAVTGDVTCRSPLGRHGARAVRHGSCVADRFATAFPRASAFDRLGRVAVGRLASVEILEWSRRPLVCSTASGTGVRLVRKGRATSNRSEPRIRLLGGFSVAVGDSVVADRAWRLRKAKALVKILALAPDRRMHRERLAELLWPERDADAATNNLNQALYIARRALDAAGADGAAALTLIDGAVVLNAQVDVDAFEAAAARARADHDPAAYERALGLHGGVLLPEDRYEPWADTRRAALTELHTALCLELAELRGDAPTAVVALQRALVADPLSEPAHRALMRLYARTGRRQQALAQYQLLRQSLSAELAAEPDPATRALYRQLLAPTPAAAPAGGGNLPRQLTSFVGRERERADIARLLERARLVTLTGPGGCGKTRLALEAAADALPELPDGAWFVDLASLSDPALVPQAAALAVGVPIPASRSAQEALVAHLATREALLVLDNCEHLIDACARLAEEVLRAGPGVRILATSREPLRCADEVAWRVPSLAEAERLFCERARAARPGFDRADGAAGAVEEICRRLDGMPLAIELAAARAAALSLDQIAARLGESLDMLGTGRRTALTRQQTLRATIDWSHDLLTGEERVLYRRLAVFAGGFTLEAAEAVCAGGAIATRRVVDLLARLVVKSLVVAEGERFRLLDTVRQYAAERLEDAAERDTVALRHLDWCLALAQEHDPLSAGQRRSLHVLEIEHDNLRAGLGWALRRDPQAALRLATRLWRFWLDRGYFAEGNRWLESTLAAAPEQTPLRVEALLAGAGLSLRLGDPNGFLRHVSDAVSAYRLLGDDRATAAALYQHATLAQYVHGTDAETLFAEALALARRLQDNRLLAAATHASATLPWYRSDNATARARVLEALALLDMAPDDDTPFFDGVTFGLPLLDEGPHRQPRIFWEETVFLFHRFARAQAIAYALNNLAWVARADGDLEHAQATLDDALARFRRLQDRRGEALTLAHMGNLARSLGDFEAARARLHEALEIRSDLGDRRAMLSTRIGLGLLAMTAGDAPAGRALLRAALADLEAVDDLPAMAGLQTNWAIGEERLGELQQAARLYENSCALLGLQRLQRFEAWGRLALHDVYVALGDEPRAQTALQRARALFVAVGDARGVPYTDAKAALSAVKQPGT